jgi:hypothetical protein
MQSLSKVYKAIAPAFNYSIGEDDLFSILTPTGTLEPAKVDGKRLAFPSNKFLRDGFGEDYQPFHPLSENLARKGTSPVLQHMQRAAKANIAFMVGYLTDALLRVAVDTSLHKDLPPEMATVLAKLANADKNTLVAYNKLMSSANKKNKIVSVFLKHGGTIDGTKVNRMAVIRFPIIDELNSGEKEVLGVDLGKKHGKVILELFKLVVPFGDSPEEYAAGTTTRVAPFFTALIKAYWKICNQLNKSIIRFNEPLHLGIKPFPLYDENIWESFPEVYNEIPPLNGNDGGVNETDEAGAPAAAQAQQQQPAAQPANQYVPQMVGQMPQMGAGLNAAAPTTASKPGDTISVSDFLKSQQPQFQQQPAPMMSQQPQMVYNQYGQPVMLQPSMATPMQNMPGFQQPQNQGIQLPWLQPQVQAMQYQQQMQQNPFMQIFAQPQQMMPQPMMMPQQPQYGGFPQQGSSL